MTTLAMRVVDLHPVASTTVFTHPEGWVYWHPTKGWSFVPDGCSCCESHDFPDRFYATVALQQYRCPRGGRAGWFADRVDDVAPEGAPRSSGTGRLLPGVAYAGERDRVVVAVSDPLVAPSRLPLPRRTYRTVLPVLPACARWVGEAPPAGGGLQ